MKIPLIAFTLLLPLATCTAAQDERTTTAALDELANTIGKQLTNSQMTFTRDPNSLTFIQTNTLACEMPGLGDPPLLWRFFTNSCANLRITILLAPKLSNEEYSKLRNLKDELLSYRTRWPPRQGRTESLSRDFTLWTVPGNEQANILRLPGYYWGRFSVSLYTSADGFRYLYPPSAASARDQIVAILDKLCTRYDAAATTNAVPKKP